MLVEEMLAGEMLVEEMLAGEMLVAEMLVGEVQYLLAYADLEMEL
jgi:hypothetical protein